MTVLFICLALMATLAMANSQQPFSSAADYLNVPEPPSFNDKSALADKNNLQSRQYQDFIHTLYRHDKDNLQRVDNLFAHPDQAAQASRQRTYVSYTQSQQPNYAFDDDNDRSERSAAASGAIFKPRFVHRIFEERARLRREDRVRRRLLISQKRNHLNYRQNGFDNSHY